MSSVSASDRRNSVATLRDRLLRDARIERQRCLENVEAAERRQLRGVGHVSVQTDPVVILDSRSGSPLTTSALGTSSALSAGGGITAATWSHADEEAQAEALRTIQLLGERGSQSRSAEGRLGDLEAELRAERASRQELEAQLAHERGRKEAAQQQVLCLEYELDGKEAALQVAERTLEQRDADLQLAQQQLRALQDQVAAAQGMLPTAASLAAEDLLGTYRGLVGGHVDGHFAQLGQIGLPSALGTGHRRLP